MRTLLAATLASVALLGMGGASHSLGPATAAFNHEFQAIDGGKLEFSKWQVVSGPQAHPFYRWARETLGAASAPTWNFHKYLIGRDGRPIGGYGAGVEPLSPQLISAIESALVSQ
jgi:glutathione peroxidase-family protein